MGNPGQVTDPYVSFEFGIEIAGIEEGSFQECSGLSSSIEVKEYKEGGLNTHSHRLPGRVTHGNITFKRGMLGSSALYDWFTRFSTKTDRSSELKDISIIVVRQDRTEAQRWNLTGAWPVKWQGPNFTESGSDALVETFEIAFSTIELVKK